MEQNITGFHYMGNRGSLLLAVIILASIFLAQPAANAGGWAGMISDGREELKKDALWSNGERNKLEPYIGKTRAEVERDFGKPFDISKKPAGRKVKYNATEVWNYNMYEDGRIRGFMTFFFIDDKVVGIDVI